MYIERYSSIQGFLQGIDPRVKLVSFTAFILIAVSVRTLMPLIILLFIIIFFSIATKIPLKFFLFRATVFIPLFAGVIALPLLFITPGTPLGIAGYGGYFIIATREGLFRAVLFTTRIWVCVAAITLLVQTTRFSVIIQALGKFKVPEIFLMMTAVTYRFIFIFIEEAYRMALAREARTTGKESRIQILKSLGKIISTLFIRAFERGERVYLAMLARGYTGRVRSLVTMKWDKNDQIYTVIIALICIAVILVEYMNHGGV